MTLFPFLSWAVANGRYAIAGGLWGMIWVPMWALSRLSLSSVTYWRAVLGTLGLVVLWIGFPSTVFPRAAWPFVASPQWLQRNMDWAPFWMPLQWIVPLLWGLALCYLFKNRSHRSHRLLLVANLLGPLGLAAGGIVSGIHYSFYQLFFLPLFFVAVAVVLTDPRFLPVPILRCLGILAIGPYVLLSLGSEMRLTRNGGFGEYCATLGQRYRALTQILEMDSEANLVIPDKGTCSGSEPWQQMRTELGGMQGSGTPFYVLEPWGKGFHPSQLDWTYTDRPEFQVGSLVVFLL